MRLRSARRAGLSLIEVLASLAIFLMALVALVHLVNTASNMAHEAHHRSNAARICQSKMACVISGIVPLQGQSDAEVEDEPEYHWSMTVDGGSAQGLSNVTVTVTFSGSKEYPISASLSRMVLDPTVCGSTMDLTASPLTSTSTASSSGSGSSGSTPAASTPAASTPAASTATTPTGKTGTTTAGKGG
jgi:type II secretion system protein I